MLITDRICLSFRCGLFCSGNVCHWKQRHATI